MESIKRICLFISLFLFPIFAFSENLTTSSQPKQYQPLSTHKKDNSHRDVPIPRKNEIIPITELLNYKPSNMENWGSFDFDS